MRRAPLLEALESAESSTSSVPPYLFCPEETGTKLDASRQGRVIGGFYLCVVQANLIVRELFVENPGANRSSHEFISMGLPDLIVHRGRGSRGLVDKCGAVDR